MGISLKELQKRAPKYDPEAKPAESKYLYEKYLDGTVLPNEEGVGEFCIEQNFIDAVDLLDKYHLLLTEISTKFTFGKKVDLQLSEARDDIGEFLQKVQTPQGPQSFVM